MSKLGDVRTVELWAWIRSQHRGRPSRTVIELEPTSVGWMPGHVTVGASPSAASAAERMDAAISQVWAFLENVPHMPADFVREEWRRTTSAILEIQQATVEAQAANAVELAAAGEEVAGRLANSLEAIGTGAGNGWDEFFGMKPSTMWLIGLGAVAFITLASGWIVVGGVKALAPAAAGAAGAGSSGLARMALKVAR